MSFCHNKCDDKCAKRSSAVPLCLCPQVYIIAHIPVGYLPSSMSTTAMREYYNEKLVDILRRYSDVIAGQFYGHTHRDSIMVLSDKKGNVAFCLCLPAPRCWSIAADLW